MLGRMGRERGDSHLTERSVAKGWRKRGLSWQQEGASFTTLIVSSWSFPCRASVLQQGEMPLPITGDLQEEDLQNRKKLTLLSLHPERLSQGCHRSSASQRGLRRGSELSAGWTSGGWTAEGSHRTVTSPASEEEPLSSVCKKPHHLQSHSWNVSFLL